MSTSEYMKESVSKALEVLKSVREAGEQIPGMSDQLDVAFDESPELREFKSLIVPPPGVMAEIDALETVCRDKMLAHLDAKIAELQAEFEAL